MKKENIRYQAKVILRGLVRTLWGTVTAGIIGLAVYGFIAIPNEGGYTAICDFFVAVCCLVLAFVSVYVQGVGSFRKAKKCTVRRH